MFSITYYIVLSLVNFAQAQLIPTDFFFKIPDKGQMKISPDGKYFSYTANYENKKNIFIENLTTIEVKRITSFMDNNVRTYYWFNDSLLIVRIDNNGDENYHLKLFNIHTLNEKELTPFKEPFSEDVNVYDDYLTASLTDDNGTRGLFKINPFSNEPPKLIFKYLDIADVNVVYDHRNVVRIVYGISDDSKRVMYYRKNATDTFHLILKTNTEDQIIPQIFDKDNKLVYCFSNLNRDKFTAVLFDPETISEKQILLESPDYDVNGEFVYDNEKKKISYITYTDWKKQYHFFDKKTEEEYNVYFKKFPKANIQVLSKTRLDAVLISVSADNNPGEYYLYNAKTKQWKKIAEINADLHTDNLATLIPVTFQSRDGYNIHGYFMTPKGKELKNLPTVVIAHGGPWTRDEWGYNGMYQFLANRNYAVFYVDFRGSRGYGKKFYSASFRAWDKMNDDIVDGVQWLVKQGYTDKQRVAIFGFSWGGFASNYSAVFYPDVYKCAITGAGPSNLFTFYDRFSKGMGQGYEGLLNVLIGNPKTDSLYFTRVSPALNINQLKTPILIWQGKKDPRVPWQEAQQMYDEAQKNNMDIELLMKEDEGHNISNVKNRIEFYSKIELFLEKHLKQK